MNSFICIDKNIKILLFINETIVILREHIDYSDKIIHINTETGSHLYISEYKNYKSEF